MGVFLDTDPLPESGVVCKLVSPTPPPDYWQIADEVGGIKYIYLTTTGGLTEWNVHTSQPTGTAFTSAVVLKGVDRRNWTVGVRSWLEILLTPRPLAFVEDVQGFTLQEFGGSSWTFFINRAGGIQIYPAADPFPILSIGLSIVSPSPSPNYLQMLDEFGGTQYVRIRQTGGRVGFVISTTLPSGTAYTGTVQLFGVAQRMYLVTVRSRQGLRVTEVS